MIKRSNRFITILFSAFIAVFFLVNLFLPDREFSPQENRYLQTLPSFSFRSLFGGTFTQDFETYASDQFAARDRWISWKARLELLQGKKENNGIFLCEGERLIKPFTAPTEAELDRRVRAVETLAAKIDVPVTLALIPTSAEPELYGSLLPEGAGNDSQRETMERIYSRTVVGTADILSSLTSHTDEYIFYRTDHHWTSLGAFWGYQALAEALGFVPRKLDTYDVKTVSESFCGTAFSASGFFWVPPDRIQTFRDAPEGLTVLRYETEKPEPSALYREEMLETKDKYRFFLGGNAPRLVLTTAREDLPSLLLLRDSYADSLVPFLLDHFSEIHLLDLRYYRDAIPDYIRDNGIDQVVVLYSVDNFCTDSNLLLMAR